jgi:effector-binding domain-containing protein
MLETPQIIQTSAQLTACIHFTIPRDEITNAFGAGVDELIAAIIAQGIAPIGSIFTHHLRRPTDTFNFELCIQVSAPINAAGRVSPSQRPAIKVAQTVYHGAYDGLPDAWGEFMHWIKTKGHTPTQDLWECYITGPHSSSDPTTWLTELNQPLLD